MGTEVTFAAVGIALALLAQILRELRSAVSVLTEIRDLVAEEPEEDSRG